MNGIDKIRKMSVEEAIEVLSYRKIELQNRIKRIKSNYPKMIKHGITAEEESEVEAIKLAIKVLEEGGKSD